jgi:putative secretion ATPase (PEP-CTERM system associated)
MYDQFFNFKTKPFELVPNPDFIYLSSSHKKAITYLDYGIKEKSGYILLSGEVGSGKTTIIRNMIKHLNGNINLSKVFNTKVSSEQLIAMINEDFGLDVSNKDKITLLRELNDFLIEQYADHRHCIIIIDEAQNLTPDLLEEVRMLSNLETDMTKLLQIILVGQPELKETLAKPELRQLRQRISISCHIDPLNRQETEEYIYHRLDVAGNKKAVRFADGSIDAIHDFSKGIPRLINIVCDFLMLSSFVEEKKEITLGMTNEVINELEIEKIEPQLELPEDDNDSYAKLFKNFMDRLKKLEEEFVKQRKSKLKKIKFSERLSTLEQQVHFSLQKSHAEIKDFDERLKHIASELNALKIQADRFVKTSEAAPAEKKAGFWRIFS